MSHIRRIGLGYIVVVLFYLGLFLLFPCDPSERRLLDDATLILVLSIVVVLPLLIEFLRPIVSTVKFRALEASFREVAERSAAVRANLNPAMN